MHWRYSLRADAVLLFLLHLTDAPSASMLTHHYNVCTYYSQACNGQVITQSFAFAVICACSCLMQLAVLPAYMRMQVQAVGVPQALFFSCCLFCILRMYSWLHFAVFLPKLHALQAGEQAGHSCNLEDA